MATSSAVRPASRMKVRAWVASRVPVTVFFRVVVLHGWFRS